MQGQCKALFEAGQGISKVDELVGDISTASQQQSDGIGQINQAVNELDGVTQSSAASAEEAASAAEELSAQAAELEHVVRQMRRLVEGARAETADFRSQANGSGPSGPKGQNTSPLAFAQRETQEQLDEMVDSF